MKTKTFFVLFGILIAGSQVGHADGNLGDLKRWKGKASFEKIGGRTFWQVPALTEALSDVLNPRELADFNTTRGPETPVEVYRSYVYGTICEAHNCGNHKYEVFVDTATDRVWVCYSTDALMKAEKVQWVTNGGRREKADACEPELDEQGNQTFSARLGMIPANLR